MAHFLLLYLTENSYAKALYRSGCYFVRSHSDITNYLRNTTNGLLSANLPVTSLSFMSESRLTLVYCLRKWEQYRINAAADILFPVFTK